MKEGYYWFKHIQTERYFIGFLSTMDYTDVFLVYWCGSSQGVNLKNVLIDYEMKDGIKYPS